MPRTTNAQSIAEKNKRSNQPIVLFLINDYDGLGSHLRFARYDTDVIFAGQTYSRFPITFKTIDENTHGEVREISIVLSNISRLIQSYLEEFEFWNKKVIVRIVWANQLSDANAKIDFTYYVDSYSANDEDVEFLCTTKTDVIDRQIPAEAYLPICRYKEFKDPDQCRYAGPETDCNRTKQRCKELGNYSRFGGFPSVPTQRLFAL